MIGPALALGYRQVWLVGISIGGFGALLYGEAHPAGISGIALFGPCLGKPAVGQAIAAQGGLARWQSPVGPIGHDQFDLGVWRWLQASTEAPRRSARPALSLGYGVDDRFAASHRLLGASLPAERVFTAAGGHDRAPWRSAWQRMLDAMPLRRDASCAVERPASAIR